ncbi:MAG TPA: GNAT family N-acetyltransferase [Myxococcota bacterium]|nr:GNAT family N-acetyltransferase [Myxococcota bacterium]
MVRPLTLADTADARSLLRARPLRNVFLDYVVSAGALGRAPGFLGYESGGRLLGILLIGPLGGTALEVQDPAAHAPLAEAAARARLRPRHIVGSEDVTEPFWEKYAPHAPALRWSRREPVFAMRAEDLARSTDVTRLARVDPAREAEADEITENSAQQHREDLGDDRYAADEKGFRERHHRDVRDGRWWVSRVRGQIVFQVHVGAASATAVQLGGVFVPPWARGRGHATRGMHAIAARMLERHDVVTLYCDEANAAARRVYERLGFRRMYSNRSYLLNEPLEGSAPAL